MNLKPPHPFRTLITGVLTILPLAATVLLLAWLLRFLSSWVGPGSAFGRMLSRVGLGVTESEMLGYAIGVALAVVLVYLVGLTVESRLQKGIYQALHAVVVRIPIVGNIYDMLKKLVDMFSQREPDGLKSMRPVWLHFGGPPDAAGADGSTPGRTAVLALLCTPTPVMLHGRPYHGVMVPTSPVPVGGGLLYVPVDWVSNADMGMEGLTSIYVSMGVTSGQYLPTLPTQPSPELRSSETP